jgi:hypothetical protein
MSVKRIEIANKLIADFPTGEARIPELKEWSVKNGYSSHAASFVWKRENRVARGLFKIPTETEIKTGTPIIPLEVLATEVAETKTVVPDTTANLMMTTDIEKMVPEKFEGFVSWGYFKEIKSIIKSKMFYPIFVTGLSCTLRVLPLPESPVTNIG